jgi:hypothetical protein
MATNDRTGLQTPDRQAEPLQNMRVTARIVREDDGTQRTEYRANGRVYPSLAALRGDAPESTHAQPREAETHVIDTEDAHV